jgi:hypothetical protein
VKKKMIGWMVLSCVVVAPSLLWAQNPPARSQESTAGRQIPLKVQVVVSRYQGEKKVSSLPYSLSVVANDNDKTSLRMGVDVPIPNTVFASPAAGGTATIPQTSYNYRSIGTNIDCSVRTLEEGMFKLDLAVEDSSVFVAEKDGGASASRASGLPAPSVRRFTSSFNLMLKDGQTAQHTSATDPVSGEVLRIDVTLNVLK